MPLCFPDPNPSDVFRRIVNNRSSAKIILSPSEMVIRSYSLAQVIVVLPTGQEPVAQQVPAMTEWGMIFFMLFAGGVSVYYLRRKRIG